MVSKFALALQQVNSAVEYAQSGGKIQKSVKIIANKTYQQQNLINNDVETRCLGLRIRPLNRLSSEKTIYNARS